MKLDSDDFELFGLARRFALDPGALDARWRALQTEVHPDKFAAQGAAAQRVAVALGLPGAQLQEVGPDPTAPGLDLTVIIGRDFLSVTKSPSATGKGKQPRQQ